MVIVSHLPPDVTILFCSSVNDQLDVHVVQTLTFSLGMMEEHPHAQHHSMATVCRMSRNVLFPPQFRTLQEWFHYAFASSEIDGKRLVNPWSKNCHVGIFRRRKPRSLWVKSIKLGLTKCSKLLGERNQHKLKWLQNPGKINGDLNIVRHETNRTFRNKIRKYVKEKIKELKTDSKSRNIRDMYRGIN